MSVLARIGSAACVLGLVALLGGGLLSAADTKVGDRSPSFQAS